ncbi:hypothetical protein [Staphylococcus auricularis]|uniref:hypothetical protein n=1 Tax=Staphylococcus auricularis TaxID=29379 RepID=UPI0024301FFE|nr:hypothetical protein [Staphylococcus auricularis]
MKHKNHKIILFIILIAVILIMSVVRPLWLQIVLNITLWLVYCAIEFNDLRQQIKSNDIKLSPLLSVIIFGTSRLIGGVAIVMLTMTASIGSGYQGTWVTWVGFLCMFIFLLINTYFVSKNTDNEIASEQRSISKKTNNSIYIIALVVLIISVILTLTGVTISSHFLLVSGIALLIIETIGFIILERYFEVGKDNE